MMELDSATDTVMSVKWPRVVLVGDSLSQAAFQPEVAWGSLLANSFQRRCDVIVRGFNGYNSRWYKLILADALDRDTLTNCVATTIFLGTNDAAGCQVPTEEYKQNLTTIIEHISLCAAGIQRDHIILITPPPYDPETFEPVARARGFPVWRRPDLYAAACRQVAASTHSTLVDLYSEVERREDWRCYLKQDGLHMNERMGALLFNLVFPHVDRALSTLNLSLHQSTTGLMPYWRDFAEQKQTVARYME